MSADQNRLADSKSKQTSITTTLKFKCCVDVPNYDSRSHFPEMPIKYLKYIKSLKQNVELADDHKNL